MTGLQKLLLWKGASGSGTAPVMFEVSGTNVNFYSDMNKPLSKLIVTIPIHQSGSGQPTPDNIRPITVYNTFNLYHSGYDASNPEVYTFDSGVGSGHGFFGTLNVITGELTIVGEILVRNTSDMNNSENYPGWQNDPEFVRIFGQEVSSLVQVNTSVSHAYSVNTLGTNSILFISKSVVNLSQSEWQALALDVQIPCYYAEPVLVQLTPQQIRTLVGINRFRTSTNEELTIDYLTRSWSLKKQGNPVEFDTNLSREFLTLDMMFYPVYSTQSHLPSPDNPITITGWTGCSFIHTQKNLAILPDKILNNDKTNHGVFFHAINHSKIYVKGTNDGKSNSYSYVDGSTTALYLKKGTYTLSTNLGGNSNSTCVYLSTGGAIAKKGSPVTVRTTYDRFVEIQTCVGIGEDSEEIINGLEVWIMLEEGSVAHEYVENPFNLYSCDFSGGTLSGVPCDGDLDVILNKLYITHRLLSFNTADMDNTESYPGWKNTNVKAMVGSGIDRFYNIYTSATSGYEINTKTPDESGTIYFAQSRYGLTQSEWKALALDIQIPISLAETQVIDLEPWDLRTFVGYNKFWSSLNADVYVEYATSEVLDVSFSYDLVSATHKKNSNDEVFIPWEPSTSNQYTASYRLEPYGYRIYNQASDGLTKYAIPTYGARKIIFDVPSGIKATVFFADVNQRITAYSYCVCVGGDANQYDPSVPNGYRVVDIPNNANGFTFSLFYRDVEITDEIMSTVSVKLQ